MSAIKSFGAMRLSSSVITLSESTSGNPMIGLGCSRGLGSRMGPGLHSDRDSRWNFPRVTATSGLGMVGSHLCDELMKTVQEGC